MNLISTRGKAGSRFLCFHLISNERVPEKLQVAYQEELSSSTTPRDAPIQFHSSKSLYICMNMYITSVFLKKILPCVTDK